MNSKKAITLLVLATLLMSMVPIMPANALTGPNLSAANGDKGDTITVTGGSVTAGATVEIYWDSVAAWNGESGLLNSTAAKASGAYELTFDVPESTGGNHYVWAKDVSTGETKVGAAFEVLIKDDLSASSGLAGYTPDLTIYGLGDEEEAALLLTTAAYAGTAVAAEAITETQVGATTVYEFTLAKTPVVPGQATFEIYDGGVAETAVDDGDGTLSGGAGAGGTIDYLTGEVTWDFNGAPAGAVTADYNYYLDVDDACYTFDVDAKASELGTIEKELTIPAETKMAKGAYRVVYVQNDDVTEIVYTIGAVISLDVDEGPSGTVVEITGKGFLNGDIIQDGEVLLTGGVADVALYSEELDAAPEAIGLDEEFVITAIIPSLATWDDYDTIEVDVDLVGDEGTATVAVETSFDVLGKAKVTVTPSHGTQGSTVTVEGQNYTAGEDVIITVDTLGAETYEVESDGTFSVAYNIPAVATGPATLAAKQTAFGIEAEDDFRAGIMLVILNPTSGPAGTLVSVTGTGFTDSAAPTNGKWNATFGDEDWQTTIATVDTEVTANLYVPTTEPGVYTVTVLDVEEEIPVVVEFEVTESTSVEADPVEAPAGFPVDIMGSNFAEDVDLTKLDIVMYNDTVEWDAADLTWATPVDPKAGTDDAWDDGYFSEEIILPGEAELSVGTYYVNITSDEGMYAQLMFDVVEKTIDISPRKAEFSVGDTIAFNVESSFAMPDSYIKISSPDGDLYWETDPFAAGMWLGVGNIERVLYADQVSGGNPLVLLDDAPLGVWTWEMYDNADDEVDDGTFTVAAAASEVISGQVEDLADALDDLSSDLSGVTAEFDDVKSDIASVESAVADAISAAEAAAEAVTAVAATANTASEAAADAAEAANAARDAASGLTTLVYGAIGAALVAALAAIVSLMQISRRIAG